MPAPTPPAGRRCARRTGGGGPAAPRRSGRRARWARSRRPRPVRAARRRSEHRAAGSATPVRWRRGRPPPGAAGTAGHAGSRDLRRDHRGNGCAAPDSCITVHSLPQPLRRPGLLDELDVVVALNPIPDLLDALRASLAGLDDGRVAEYIPELAHADPTWFGLALATLDGHVYASGDADRPFTLQSVSKPFVYALALTDRGLDEVVRRVGLEPSGEAFNATRLEPGTGRPPNPMVNAGAILTASLVADGFPRVLAGLGAFAGRVLGVDERAYESEVETGDRNRAIAYLMRTAGSLQADAEQSVRRYFRQCAVQVTARDLAVMSATLANGGVNPVTGEPVVTRDVASHVLTVMATCGMYDFAGEWLLRVGLPAKSGVSGGIAAALPAQLGIGLFSPPLDDRGTSVRGIAACEELSARFGLHLMRPPARTASAVYLVENRGHVLIRGLQGDFGFAAAEALTRELAGQAVESGLLVLDLDRVGQLHPVAAQLLGTLIERLTAYGMTAVVADGNRRDLLPSAYQQFTGLDQALRWCEARLVGI
ncbi:MAG: glutaminase A [Hamadaea sp.]|nr:glutaminase A [Hamadaea sp.]